MISTHKNYDFEVGNVQCKNCNENLYFNHEFSNSWNARFYCKNDKCPLANIILDLDMVNRQRVILQTAAEIREDDYE